MLSRRPPLVRPPSLTALLAAGLCVAALLAAMQVSQTIFDGVPHLEDEVVFIFQARTLAAGHLVAPAPPRPEFFEFPFILVRDGYWFGKYPPGFPAVLALGVLAGQPWLVNPLGAALCVALVYRAGSRLYDRTTGLLAAGLLVSSPLFLLHGGSYLSHVASLVWALAALLLFQHAREQRSAAAALGAGLALGALFLARPLTAIGVGLPYALWAGVDLLHRRRLYGLAMLIGFLPAGLALLIYNRLTTGDPLRNAYEVYWPHDRVGFGPGLDSDGYHSLEEGLENTGVVLGSLTDYLFGWPYHLSLAPALLAASLAGGCVVWGSLRGRRPRAPGPVGPSQAAAGQPTPSQAWDLLHLSVIVSLIGLYVAYWASKSVYGPRYYFEALGAFSLLSARGVLLAADLMAALLGRLAPAWKSGRRWALAAVLLLVAGLAAHNLTSFAPAELGRHAGWYGIDGADLRRVAAGVARPALVFVDQAAGAGWPRYAPFFAENAPTLDGAVVYAVDRGAERNRELMALYPDRAVYRYAESRLEPLPALQP